MADTLTNVISLSDQKSGYSIRVRTTDQTGLSFERDFTISVDDNRAGTKDRTFDGDGIVTSAIGPANDLGRSVAIQSDGKILVTGESSNGSNDDFAVTRYNANGTLDTSFGIGGSAVLDFADSTDNSVKLAIQNSEVNGADDFALARYTVDGTLDSTFSNNTSPQPRIVTINIGSGNDSAGDIVLQRNKIILVGYSLNGPPRSSTKDFSAVRYLSSGEIDTTFGGSRTGILTPSFSAGSQDSARSIAIAPDGKLILAGYSESGVRSYFELTRYSVDGILDSTFDNDGKVTTDISDQGQVNDIVIQPDGKIVAVGNIRPASTGQFSIQVIR